LSTNQNVLSSYCFDWFSGFAFERALKQQTMDDKENALRLEWTFGFNNKLTNGVHNLASGDRYALFYVSAHSGVIYDTAERTQTLLQGHKVNGRFFVCLFFQWS
jgi:hypothetical protein